MSNTSKTTNGMCFKTSLVLGIDLAGSEKRNTGICSMDRKMNCICKTVKKDGEIFEIVKITKPKVIAIDAPLSLPKGRRSIDKKSNIHFRECDRELWKLHIKFFPITLGPMRMLTKRGMKIAKKLRGMGYEVIEVYPGATQDILGIKRKQYGLKKLKRDLEKIGIKFNKKKLNGDELDAATAAYTGLMYLKGDYEALGDPEEGQIIIPKLR